MTDETNVQPQEGAAEGEEQKELVTLAEDDAEEDIEVGTDDEDEEDGDDESGDDKPRKKSRSQRRKEKVARLERENAELRRPRGGREAVSVDNGDEEPVRPKEEDFPNDFMAYQEAVHQWNVDHALWKRDQKNASRDAEREAEREHSARLNTYNRNLDRVRDRIPDFDRVMADSSDMEIRDDVRDLILESDKGPLLAYYLAKHPEKVAELNGLKPAAAAKELGRLEARIRGPQPKAATTARKPTTPPKGGTATPAKDPAKMSPAEYYAWRAAGNG